MLSHRLRDGFSVSNALLLDAANSNTAKGFFTARPEAIKKNCAVVAGFRRPFRFNA